MSIFTELLIASAMVTATIAVHLAGLAMLLELMRQHRRVTSRANAQVHAVSGIVIAVYGLFALHSVEIWSYALLYYRIGALPDFEAALYFSTSTYATIGYGDLVLPKAWRVLGAIEGANGVILLGWSTAFFVAIVARIRMLESWLAADAA
ncbi:MAG: potassium channel family protein [Sphingomonas sp.]